MTEAQEVQDIMEAQEVQDSMEAQDSMTTMTSMILTSPEVPLHQDQETGAQA